MVEAAVDRRIFSEEIEQRYFIALYDCDGSFGNNRYLNLCFYFIIFKQKKYSIIGKNVRLIMLISGAYY